MTNIIVVLPKLEEAKGVKNILVRSGFQVTGICTTGTERRYCDLQLQAGGHDIHRTT